MRSMIRVSLAAAFAMTMAGAAQATVFSYSTTLDLSTGVHSSQVGFDIFRVGISGAPSFALRNGDTINGTILFADNKAITLFGPDYSYAYLNLSSNIPNVNTSEDTTVGLLGVSGSMVLPNPDHETIFSGFGAVGPIIGPTGGPTPGLTNSSITFTGMTYSLTLTSDSTVGPSIVFPSFTPAYFEVADKEFRGGVDIVQAPQLPEPASIALFAVGMAGVAGLRRRRR